MGFSAIPLNRFFIWNLHPLLDQIHGNIQRAVPPLLCGPRQLFVAPSLGCSVCWTQRSAVTQRGTSPSQLLPHTCERCGKLVAADQQRPRINAHNSEQDRACGRSCLFSDARLRDHAMAKLSQSVVSRKIRMRASRHTARVPHVNLRSHSARARLSRLARKRVRGKMVTRTQRGNRES